MYSRVVDDEILTFEASGGLLNAGLVMLDHQTRSYWSIMTEGAIWGELEGQRLQSLPGARKMTFGQWRQLHPQTLVLSANGTQHDAVNPYDRYFSSPGGFRGLSASDGRMQDKALLYGLHVEGTPWVIAHDQFMGGGVVTVADRALFLYREQGDAPFQGSAAWWLQDGDLVETSGEDWVLKRQDTEHRFDPASRSFSAEPALAAATGFDTYWYIWSLTNPDTQIAASTR